MRIRRKYGITFCLLPVKKIAYPFVNLILVSSNEWVTAAINITLTLLFPNCSDYTNHQKTVSVLHKRNFVFIHHHAQRVKTYLEGAVTAQNDPSCFVRVLYICMRMSQ